MEEFRRNRLVEIMATDHDPAAEVALFLEFGAEVGRVVRASARAQAAGWRLSADDLDDLTFDACIELYRMRRSWRPDGGALPWRWARARIDALVRARIGPPRRRLQLADLDQPCDEAVPWTAPAGGQEAGAVTTLSALASADGRAELAQRLIRRLRPRVAEMLLRYQIQVDAGDPSPSHTIGAEFGLRPPAVRQAVARARRRLHEVVQRNSEFAPLRSSPLLRMGVVVDRQHSQETAA